MIGTRHLGYFIHHTLKPLIEEMDKIMGKCQNLKIDKYTLEYMFERLIWLEIHKALIYCGTYLIIAGALCISLYFILL